MNCIKILKITFKVIDFILCKLYNMYENNFEKMINNENDLRKWLEQNQTFSQIVIRIDLHFKIKCNRKVVRRG